MSGIAEQVRAELFALQDLGYKEFHCRLMPTIILPFSSGKPIA